MTRPDHDSSRRALLKGAVALTLASRLPSSEASSGTIATLAGSTADRVTLAAGLRHDVVLRWGDPLFEDAPALDARLTNAAHLLSLRPGTAGRQFGYNCDAVQYFPLQHSSRHGLVCVNHEYASEDLIFPGMPDVEKPDATAMRAWVLAHPTAPALAQQMHGVSVAEISRDVRGRWRAVRGSRYARRITASTPCEIRGPARGHALMKTSDDPAGVRVLGTFANCAAGQTPWGTYLTAEENLHKYFGNGAAYETLDARLREAHRRLRTEQVSAHGWEFMDRRFDLGAEPSEPLRFGWIVEIDPYDPDGIPVKRTALGRCKHECATATLAADGRVVVYSGDDERFEYVYKFVSARAMHPTDRAANRDLLDEGVLYVARFDPGGRGQWLPLVHGHGPLVAANGFADQGDVVIKARAAADLLGATPMDRPEDVAVDAGRGRVFVSLTNNALRLPESRRGSHGGRELDLGPNAANPRGPNPFGHIIELSEAGGDFGASDFEWEILVMGGEQSKLGSPDNLAYGRNDRLWVVSDGDQPGGTNDGCFVVETAGPERGRVRQVMSAPVGAEVCGCEFTPDGRTLFLSIQHPGEGGSVEQPRSTWPDGPGYLPRPSLIAITREDGEPL